MSSQGNGNGNSNGNSNYCITKPLCDAKMAGLGMAVSEVQRRVEELEDSLTIEVAKAGKTHSDLCSQLKEDTNQKLALYQANAEKNIASIKSTIIGAMGATTFILAVLMYIFNFLRG